MGEECGQCRKKMLFTSLFFIDRRKRGRKEEGRGEKGRAREGGEKETATGTFLSVLILVPSSDMHSCSSSAQSHDPIMYIEWFSFVIYRLLSFID